MTGVVCMPTLVPTEEQQIIIDAAKNTNDNLIIIALAGAAKTSTLVMVATELPTVKSVCLAFNRNIANEMSERLPSNCTSMTLNGLGHRIWSRHLGNHNLTLEINKLWSILQSINDNRSKYDRLYGSDAKEVIDAVKIGKTSGFMPSDVMPGRITPLYDETNFFDLLEFEPNSLQHEFILEITKESFKQAFNGLIDFDDQLLCPTIVDDVGFTKFPLTFTDESQDFSKLNQLMIWKMVKDRRLIAVGDPKQAIYGFRGADTESMEHLAKMFDMKEYKLTVSFRCAKKIVENVHWHAPEMKSSDFAVDGEVVHYDGWSSGDIPDNSAILCRNNAPLFPVFMNLLSDNRYPELSNKEIINKLVRVLKDLGSRSKQSESILISIDRWLDNTLKKLNENDDPSPYQDMSACLKFIVSQHETLGEALDWTNNLRNQKGSISLSTMHKAKGLEYDTVFILDEYLIKDTDQDPNLKYVAETRAKLHLGYINSELYVKTINE